MVECRALMAGLVVTALGQALPEKRVGDLKGGANHVYLSGPARAGGMFLMYEYPTGGTGASLGVDGNHGARAFPEGDFNAVWATEVVEAQCPIQVVSYAIRDGSCGDGQFRGGCGIRRELRVLSDKASLSVLADKCVIPPFGVSSGTSGAANRFVVVRDGQEVHPSPVPGKVGDFPLRRGDIVRIETAGGGGYGDPIERDPARVRADVALGYLDADRARRRYGLVLKPNGAVDEQATGQARRRLSADRVMVTLRASATDAYEGSRRCISISAAVAGRLAVAEGGLVELVASTCGATLRGWAKLEGRGNDLTIGPLGLAVLGAETGTAVEIRAVAANPA
jgi:N-methylhydantoinase B